MINNTGALIPEIVKPVAEKRVWGFWSTVGFGAVILVGFVIAQVVVLSIAIFAMASDQFRQLAGAPQYEDIFNIISDTLNANLGLLQSIATIFSGIVGTGLVFVFVRARRRASIPEYLGLNKMSWKKVLLVFAVVIGFIVLADGLYILLGEPTSEQIMFDIYATSVWPPLFWIAVVVFAPLFEEALFRGFLFEGFRQSRLGAIGAVVLTAFAWALLHSLQYNVYSILWIFVLGIVMGIVRVKTSSIWSTFIMHALVNFVATLGVALNLPY